MKERSDRLKFETLKERNDLVQSYEKFVVSRVRKLCGSYNEDLFQEGMLGLIIAVDKFDENSGFKISTYAAKYVDGRILNYINKNSNKHVIRSVHNPGTIQILNHDKIDSFEKISNFENDIISKIILSDIIMKMKRNNKSIKKYSTIYKSRLYGFSQKEISKRMGISQPNIYRSLSLLRKKYLSAMSEN